MGGLSGKYTQCRGNYTYFPYIVLADDNKTVVAILCLACW